MQGKRLKTVAKNAEITPIHGVIPNAVRNLAGSEAQSLTIHLGRFLTLHLGRFLTAFGMTPRGMEVRDFFLEPYLLTLLSDFGERSQK